MGCRMGVGVSKRARRAVGFFVGMALLAPAKLIAGPLDLHKLVGAFDLRNEPFGRYSAPVTNGGLLEKWAGVQIKLREEQLALAACRDDRAHCANPAAAEFLAIVDAGRARDGLARIGEINRAFNLAIRPVSDLVNYGQVDVWSSPLATLAKGSGDCEDYAIAKMVALKEAGIASEDLRLVILRDMVHGEDHAVLAVRLQGQWLMLDNRMFLMLSDNQLAQYRPIFSVDDEGVHAFRDAAPTPQMVAFQQDIAYLISAQLGAGS